MKSGITNLITEEIFAQWPAHFCRVADVVAGNWGVMLKNMLVFQVFSAAPGLFSAWHDRC
jgi:hypothetical protein